MASLSEGCGINGIESLEAARVGAGVLPPHDFTANRLDGLRRTYPEQITPKTAIFQTEENHLDIDKT
jgi:hypothetical protein